MFLKAVPRGGPKVVRMTRECTSMV